MKPDGIYLLTVIDSLQDGPFLRAALRTMQASFADVRLLSPTDDWDNAGRSVYVLAGCSKQCSWRIESLLKQTGAFSLPKSKLGELAVQDVPHGIIFTYQYAPVDTLIARRFLGQDPVKPLCAIEYPAPAERARALR